MLSSPADRPFPRGPETEEDLEMLNWLLRLRRLRGDARAMRRGPEAVGKRAGRRLAHRLVNRLLR